MFDLYTVAMITLMNDAKALDRKRLPDRVSWSWWRAGLAGLALLGVLGLALL